LGAASAELGENGFPFPVVRVPNSLTLAAMREAEQNVLDSNRKTYKTAAEMFADMEEECTE
jgi:hypothetical protein